MIDEREIDVEIARLEYAESSYPNYSKLAILYAIKDRLHRGEQIETMPRYDAGYSADSGTVTASGTSDFLQAVNGKDTQRAWEIIDDLMDTLSVVNSRVYDGVMSRLKRL